MHGVRESLSRRKLKMLRVTVAGNMGGNTTGRAIAPPVCASNTPRACNLEQQHLRTLEPLAVGVVFDLCGIASILNDL
jgi:hypothetical protein